jgi:hypothetical protein
MTSQALDNHLEESEDKDLLDAAMAEIKHHDSPETSAPKQATLKRHATLFDLTTKQLVHLDRAKCAPKTFAFYRQIGPIKYVVAYKDKVGVGVACDGAFVAKKNWLFDIDIALAIMDNGPRVSEAISKLLPFEMRLTEAKFGKDEATGVPKDVSAYYLSAGWKENYGYTIHLRWHQDFYDSEGKIQHDKRIYGRGVAFTVEEFKQFLHYLPHAAIAAKVYNLMDLQLTKSTVTAIGRDVLAFLKDAPKKDDKITWSIFASAAVELWFEQAAEQDEDLNVTALMENMNEEDRDPLWKPMVTLFVAGQKVMEEARPLLSNAVKNESTLKTLGQYNEEAARNLIGKGLIVVSDKSDNLETTEAEGEAMATDQQEPSKVALV